MSNQPRNPHRPAHPAGGPTHVEILHSTSNHAEPGPAAAPAPPLSLPTIRENQAQGNTERQWQGLEQLQDPAAFRERARHEFPRHHLALEGLDRRDFLKLSGASLALAGMTACTRQPMEKIVPYVKPPEEAVPGRPLFFATTCTFAGYGTGVLAESHLGRPTKLEGNPHHPASLGGTDAITQATILDLSDPDRSTAVRRNGRPTTTWAKFMEEFDQAVSYQASRQGDGLRILAEAFTSPTLKTQVDALLAKYPKAVWISYEPISRDHARAGSRLAFGRIVDTHYNVKAADVILSLDADFLCSGPGNARYARDFASRRDLGAGHPHLNRFYAVESMPTATGTNADHHLPLGPDGIEALVQALAAHCKVIEQPAALDDALRTWCDTVARDFEAHRGAGIVLAGDHLSPEAHALVHGINQALGNVGQTVFHVETAEIMPAGQQDAFAKLIADLDAGNVDVLVILGGNPVYNAPGDLDLATRIPKAKTTVHWGPYVDETARLCQWHVPATHYLESWGDARAFDGTASIIQPLIVPLYQGHTVHELVGIMIGQAGLPPEEYIKNHWQDVLGATGFDKAWRRTLHDGVVAGSAAGPLDLQVKTIAPPALRAPRSGDLAVQFRADPAIWDGRFANNPWLQELPKPVTRVTWDNVIQISPRTAEAFGVKNEDLVELRVPDKSKRSGYGALQGPAWIVPGHADDVVTVSLGFGRTVAGRAGDKVGVDAYPLRTSSSPWLARGAILVGPLGHHPVASTQLHTMVRELDDAAERRALVRSTTLDEYRHHPDFAQHVEGDHTPSEDMTLIPAYDYSKGAQWGMTIDLNTCIGCNACVTACQAENNIPSVGKDEVLKGRELHWIRIDRYFEGTIDNPTVHNQPMMCVHCERAPCELVCPVGATVHSAEGLNQMVYNRCVGTRYCSNNCPYKVRRFNFFQYADHQTPSQKAQRNPDVTVRSRGVMEKCTYCVQRISAARIDAKVNGRELADGDVVTACQAACPAGAIVFGNINDPDSAVSARRNSPLSYGLLGTLNTQPRTTYLAKVRNPNPELAGGHA